MKTRKETEMSMWTARVPGTACATLLLLAAAGAIPAEAAARAAGEGGGKDGTREFRAAAGGKLTLDLDAGGSVEIVGTGGSSIIATYTMRCRPECEIRFEEGDGGLRVVTDYVSGGDDQSSDVDLKLQVPSRYDIDIDSVGGGLSIEGVEGVFEGKTMGGELDLRDVRGEARLETMGGDITLVDAELDGSLDTMGGEVRFENVVGDVKGSSMGGNVSFRNVQRRDGGYASPPRIDEEGEEVGPDTVQISTMGGDIEVVEAPEGARLQTMGGDIEVRGARRFVKAKTMGGEIRIESVDGSVDATSMGGDIDVTVTGGGGDVRLVSMSGTIVLQVPSGMGMDLDLEIAYTRNSTHGYRIEAPGGLTPAVTPEWDYDHGSPRKYIRMKGAVNGGGNTVRIRTVNGDITIR